MSNLTTYITATCTIRDHQVAVNGAPRWQQPGMALPDFLRAGYDHFGGQYPKFHKMDTLSKLGWLAAEVLLQQRPLSQYNPEEVGIVLVNRSASLDTDLRYYDTVQSIASPAVFVYTLPNIVMGEISIRHGFKGEQTFFTADRYDAALMHTYVQYLLDTGVMKAAICGWVEVMQDAYEVVLYLVEQQPQGLQQAFTSEAISALC
ncbi:hypothetical protein KTO58_17725 [Chitinophaga pendula]|uniref:hypothetical protein n=1 Tax=Chitinophaga TaxID=79328 RepID=UPI000BAF20DE|nr:MULTISPECIES: hypothetical protein [Chitinophaga]ASZ11464.1 hypothetical protein CK934_11105 [Chitinophaga sp. MD30]UCJ05526.1 hypothetical protein KTO58_17725 [Chitinophaga pendula]